MNIVLDIKEDKVMDGFGQPKLSRIVRTNGVAGQFAYSVNVTYPDDPEPGHVTFISSIYGAPIVMVTPSGHQTFVDRDVVERCGGTLDREWAKRFFGVTS